ncbi:MAG: phosphoribosyltransferase-like protein [Panacagrimonas sp.]
MNHNLAMRLLGQQLDWDDQKFQDELQYLRLMVDYKYDTYQGFQPASRFYVALIGFLSQFPTVDTRRLFYDFIRDKLIFVSQREMHHLVSLLMPIIERDMRARVAQELKIPLYQAWTDNGAKNRLKLMKRRTLYVGVSDGARVDVFRRFNEGEVSNEQVVATNEISASKWDDLLAELTKNLKKMGFEGEEAKFERVVLIDDFAGSGSSFVKKKETGEWSGKINRFVKAASVKSVLCDHCLLHVHHHLMSKKAIEHINDRMAEFTAEFQQFSSLTTCSYQLPEAVVISDAYDNADLVAQIRRCYDSGICDEHTGVDIWYGYKRCGLPLVLEHNTPNNSIALLWASSKDDTKEHQMRSLFPRRKRHSSDV